MARLARLVILGLPHHVIQRGNGREPTFFSDGDCAFYCDLLAASYRAAGVEVWARAVQTEVQQDEASCIFDLERAVISRVGHGGPAGSPFGRAGGRG